MLVRDIQIAESVQIPDEIGTLRYRGEGSMEYVYQDFIYKKGTKNKYIKLISILMQKSRNQFLKIFS